MSKTMEKQTGFVGTYFDREAVLLVSRVAGIFAWIALLVYGIAWLISFTQFVIQFSTGMFFQKGVTIVDLASYFTPYFVQLVPGLIYFIGMKFAQNALLLLLDIEDNTRRAARGR